MPQRQPIEQTHRPPPPPTEWRPESDRDSSSEIEAFASRGHCLDTEGRRERERGRGGVVVGRGGGVSDPRCYDGVGDHRDVLDPPGGGGIGGATSTA